MSETVTPAFTLQVLHQSDLEASLPALGRMSQSAAIFDLLEDTQPNTIKVINGDAWLPGPFYAAEGDAAVTAALRAFYGNPLQTSLSTRVSVAYMNAIDTDVASFGNHEFDAGTAQIADGIRRTTNATGGVTNEGARFPYLSANYDFSNDPNLRTLVSPDGQEASSIPGRIAGSTVVTVNGERVGIVGVTTQILASISSPGLTVGKTPNADDVVALAAVTQPYIDALRAQGINKIIVSSHLQQYQLETALAPLLSGVDIIISAGSHVLFSDSTDTLRAGDAPVQTYPLLLADRDGNPVLQVQTQNEYSYVGRLVVGFDAEGLLLPSSVDPAVSGNFVTTDANVAALYGGADPYAAGSKGAQVRALSEAVGGVIRTKDGAVQGFTNTFLNGNRTDVRTEETNLGNASADANLLVARQVEPGVLVSIKNSGGIRDVIGSYSTDAQSRPVPPAANPGAGKPSGAVSQLDIENSLRFNNSLTLVTVSALNFAQLIEHGVAAAAPGATPGQFPQVSGISFSFDPSRTAQVTNAAGIVTRPGERVRSLAILNPDGSVADVILRDGVLQGDPARPVRAVTLNFLADGGDGYRFDVYGSSRADLLNNAFLPDGAATFAAKGSEQDAFAEYLRATAPTAAQALDLVDTATSADQRIQNLSARGDTVLLGQARTQLTAVLDARAASTGPVNVVAAADAASLPAPVAGRTNVAQLTPAAPGATFALPAGYQAGVLAGPNAAALTSAAPNAVLAGGAAGGSLTSTGVTSTLIAGAGSTSLQATGGGNVVTGGAGNDSMAGGGTFFTGAGNNLVSLNETGSTVRAEGRDTIFAGLAGPATDVVGAGAGSAGTLVFAGGGRLTFINGGASSTVAGGAGGSTTVFGGAGGGIFQGGTGGNNVLIGQGGTVTLFGGGSGDLLYADGAGQNILVASGGNSTLNGGAASGGNVFVAGAGAGAATTITGGSGADIIFANTGRLVADGGAGVDLFVFTADRPGGTNVVNGFTPGQDRLALLGYGAGEAGRALAARQVANGSTTLTLVDNTRVTFTGVTNLTSSAFI